MGQGNDTATCIVMIETKEGLATVDEIVRVAGVHAVYVGPNDLPLSLGLGRQWFDESPALTAAIDAVISAAHAAGVDGAGAADARYWRERGADFMVTHTDSVLLLESARAAALALNHATADEPQHPGRRTRADLPHGWLPVLV